MRRWRSAVAAGVAAALVLCGALLGAPGSGAAVPALRIGVLLPLSGRNAAAGQSNLFGMRLVVDTVNAGGGVTRLGGAPIELVIADNASVPVSSAAEARRLIEMEHVVFILGPYATPEVEATLPVSERAGVGLISTQGSFDELFRRRYRGLTTVSMTSSQFGQSYAGFLEWLNKEHGAGIKTVAITYPDNDYGQTAAKAAARGLAPAGISVVSTRGFPPTAQDLTPIVLLLKQLKPDAVVSIGYFQDGVLLDDARVAQGYTGQPIWVGGSASFTDDRLWRTLGERVARAALGPRTFGLAQFDSAARTPGVQWLVEAARRRDPHAIVDQAMAAGAQAAWVLVEALEHGATAKPRELAAAVRRVRIPPTSPRVSMPQFLSGVAFDASGKPLDPTALFVQWDNGVKQIVYPESLKTRQVKLR